MSIVVLAAALVTTAAFPVASAGHATRVTTIAPSRLASGPEPNEPIPMPPRRSEPLTWGGPKPAEPIPMPPRRVA